MRYLLTSLALLLSTAPIQAGSVHAGHPAAASPRAMASPLPNLGTYNGKSIWKTIGDFPSRKAAYVSPNETIGNPGYVCGNYANGFNWSCREAGFRCWAFLFGCTGTKPDGTNYFRHAVNIIETDWPSPGLHRFCVVEPQHGSGVTCWVQEAAEPELPNLNDRFWIALQGEYPRYRACIQAGAAPMVGGGIFKDMPQSAIRR
jgi:hypothetical protein